MRKTNLLLSVLYRMCYNTKDKEQEVCAMGYFVMVSGEKVIEGNLSLPKGELLPEQKAAAAMDHGNYQEVTDPFLLVLITYTPGKPIPYHLTHISPSYYSYFAFDEEDFNRHVRDRDLHRQDTYKLVYIREGELFQRVESQRHKYTAGSCFLLNRNVRHNEEYTGPYSLVCLFLSEQVFRELITEDGEKYLKTQQLWNRQTELFRFFENELDPDSRSRKSYIDFIAKEPQALEQDSIEAYFDQLAQQILDPKPGTSFLIRGLICRILWALGDKHRYTTAPLELGTEVESRIFSQISALLELHDGRFSREALSRELNYSGNYLNRIVNKYTGMNITQYASSLTMRKAAELLRHSDLTVTEIALQLGYSNRTLFYNAFERAYGETPRQYRLRHLAERGKARN